jgi:ubiquinone/menaquinone biosynthesis C-methylase UbiE
MGAPSETERVRVIWEGLAATYDRGDRLERWLVRDARAWVCAQARGEVLELGIGTGRNLPHYPVDVSLTGIDLSPRMLDLARTRATQLGRRVDLSTGDAQELPFQDGRFDTVVCTYTLCSIPNDRRAIAEVWRVLKPGGRFLSAEHVRSPNMLVRAIERLLDGRSIRGSGDHLLRDPLDHLAGAGFIVGEVHRWRLGFMERLAATKPYGSRDRAHAAEG